LHNFCDRSPSVETPIALFLRPILSNLIIIGQICPIEIQVRKKHLRKLDTERRVVPTFPPSSHQSALPSFLFLPPLLDPPPDMADTANHLTPHMFKSLPSCPSSSFFPPSSLLRHLPIPWQTPSPRPSSSAHFGPKSP
jgi:hypothetical protein